MTDELKSHRLSLMAANSGPTVGSLFRDAANRRPQQLAIISGEMPITYAELNRRVNRIASHFRMSGLTAGDRIAILSENRPEYLELLLASAKTGIIAACQNWRQSLEELEYCIGLVGPKRVYVSPRFEAIARTSKPEGCELLVFGDDYERAIAAASSEEAPISAKTEDGLLILYTSGTTGRPKGALISHRAMIARSMAMMVDWAIRPDDGFVAWSPFYHMASADPTISAMTQGGTVTIIDGFDADAIARSLSVRSCGWLVLMPGMMERMIDALKVRNHAVKRVAAAGCMANLVPPEQIAEVTRLLNAPFLNSFGSTETGVGPASGAMIAVGKAPKDFAKLQSSLCEIRLLDDGDHEVPFGEIGEMCVRSPMLFSGYWNAEADTARDFRDGWFHMGDDFRRNDDGTLTYIDRRKYLIKSGGENIYPAEIELVLKQSPRIGEAVVVRQMDPKWGEIPVAFVSRRDPALTIDDVMQMLDGKIGRYKRPRRLIFVEETFFIRNTTGKIQRNLLEDKLREMQA